MALFVLVILANQIIVSLLQGCMVDVINELRTKYKDREKKTKILAAVEKFKIANFEKQVRQEKDTSWNCCCAGRKRNSTDEGKTSGEITRTEYKKVIKSMEPTPQELGDHEDDGTS